MTELVDWYGICPMEAIAPGEARGFSLLRRDANGEDTPSFVFIHRLDGARYVAYENACPHEGVWLNIRTGDFLTPDGRFLHCGRHGGKFELESGLCVEGPCENKRLKPVAVALIEGDVCLSGIDFVEEEGLRGFYDDDDTMEIMIQPD